MTINVLPEPRTSASASAFARMLPGLALSGALAATGIALGRITWLQDHGFSALTLAIVLGMIVGNTVYPWAPRWAVASGAGVNFSKQNLLRLGVVLYGLRLTVQDNGVGFSAESMYREGSHGLMGIRERAYMLGGELEIGNVRGGGGRIRVRLPLRTYAAGLAAAS